MGGQGAKRRRKIAEGFNRLSRVHQVPPTLQTTDGTAIAYSEREREFTFTFAKNYTVVFVQYFKCVYCLKLKKYIHGRSKDISSYRKTNQ